MCLFWIMKKLAHISTAGILHWNLLKSFWKLQELSNNEPLENYKLICTPLFPLLFCLMTKVLMIQSGITHETKPQITQKTNGSTSSHLLSSSSLHKTSPLQCSWEICTSWLSLFRNLLCVETSGFLSPTERWQAISIFPFDCFPYSKSEREDIWLLLKQAIEREDVLS